MTGRWKWSPAEGRSSSCCDAADRLENAVLSDPGSAQSFHIWVFDYDVTRGRGGKNVSSYFTNGCKFCKY